MTAVNSSFRAKAPVAMPAQHTTHSPRWQDGWRRSPQPDVHLRCSSGGAVGGTTPLALTLQSNNAGNTGAVTFNGAVNALSLTTFAHGYNVSLNAGGTITACDAPRQFASTWEFGGQVSWIEVRLVAGKPGETDLETMLQAAASAWPADRPPVEQLRYESGRLTLAAGGWSEQQVAQFRSLLQPAGWQVEANGAQLVLSRGRPGARS